MSSQEKHQGQLYEQMKSKYVEEFADQWYFDNKSERQKAASEDFDKLFKPFFDKAKADFPNEIEMSEGAWINSVKEWFTKRFGEA